MPYTYAKLGQAKQQLANRLADSAMQFFTSMELGNYITEALRTWNSITSFHRADFILNLTSDIWYDIPSVTNTLRPYTVTDEYVEIQMQYSLLEPPTGLTWTGSLQFTSNDLQNAIQRRRNEILAVTSCTVSRHVVPASLGRTELSQAIIDIRRVAWLPVGFGYVNVPMFPADRATLGFYQSEYTTQAPGIPTTYDIPAEPPLSFTADIPPAVPGDYEVLTVDAGEPLSATTPTYLGIPDDFEWVVKFGALADLFSRESNAKDNLRAAYCNMRYTQGVGLLLTSPAVLSARIQNLPLQIDSTREVDLYRPMWMAETPTEPDTMMAMGLNLIGFAPPPGSGPYSVTLTVVRNAPIPATDDAPIQLGQDDYDVMLDYAQHLASLKLGGAEFMATLPLFKRFMQKGAIYNSKLEQLGDYQKYMYQLSQSEAESNPVLDKQDVDSMGVSQ